MTRTTHGRHSGISTVLVFGATGTQGGAVARHLLRRGYGVVAAARRADAAHPLALMGATPIALELSRPASVAAAARGVDAAFVHLPMSFGAPGDPDRARSAIDALVDAGVRHIVFSTSGPLPESPVGIPYVDGKVDVARHVLATGRGTVLKPTGYMENFSAPWSAPRVLAGELAYPLPPEIRVAWITNEDVARYADAALGTPAAIGRSYAVAGPEPLDGPSAAERLAQALGRRVVYRQVSGGDYAATLAPFLGEAVATMIGSAYDQAPPRQDPAMLSDPRPSAEALGVEPTSLEAWARAHDWGSFTAAGAPSRGLVEATVEYTR